MRHIVVVRRDRVDDERVFAVARCHFDAELHVRSLVLVREHLADVVQQGPAFGHGDIETEFRRHDSRQVCHLFGMVEDVLPVAGAPFHAPDKLDDLGM